ncbi:hypothetical protein CRENBAI_012158 [Crenichthys baileyi]|uniref:Uncharacterized protein n=1 Tax=Crenichthys baileyi TaxID=28760 RepID=A0AAV9S1A0_9TELE
MFDREGCGVLFAMTPLSYHDSSLLMWFLLQHWPLHAYTIHAYKLFNNGIIPPVQFATLSSTPQRLSPLSHLFTFKNLLFLSVLPLLFIDLHRNLLHGNLFYSIHFLYILYGPDFSS